MINYISGLVFVVLLLLGGVGTLVIAQHSVPLAFLFMLGWLFVDVVISSSIRLAASGKRRWSSGSASSTRSRVRGCS